MNNRKFVLSVYPSAYCELGLTHWRVYYSDPDVGDRVIGSSTDKELSWKDAALNIKEEMLRKLEQ
jgi:hypothetical protein